MSPLEALSRASAPALVALLRACALLLAAAPCAPARGDALEPLAPAASSEAPPGQLELTAPLGLRTQGVLRELFVDPILLDTRPRDSLEVNLRWTAANDWSIPTQLVRAGQLSQLTTDEQADALTARVRVPCVAAVRRRPRRAAGERAAALGAALHCLRVARHRALGRLERRRHRRLPRADRRI